MGLKQCLAWCACLLYLVSLAGCGGPVEGRLVAGSKLATRLASTRDRRLPVFPLSRPSK